MRDVAEGRSRLSTFKVSEFCVQCLGLACMRDVAGGSSILSTFKVIRHNTC